MESSKVYMHKGVKKATVNYQECIIKDESVAVGDVINPNDYFAENIGGHLTLKPMCEDFSETEKTRIQKFEQACKSINETLDNYGKNTLNYGDISAFLKHFGTMGYSLFDMLKRAKSPQEKEIARQTQARIYSYYDKLVEENHKMLSAFKSNGKTDARMFLMIDENGNPQKAKIAGLSAKTDELFGTYYLPVYSENCRPEMLGMLYVYELNSSDELKKHLDSNLPPHELLKSARALKESGLLKSKSPDISPRLDYDMTGMTNQQRDAQAWENWAIENNMYKKSDSEQKLDSLIAALERAANFLDKVQSFDI